MEMSQQIGRYEIIEELGEGGMATVYRAYDPNFGREVAVKVLPRGQKHDATFRQRFEQEAQTIAALEHSAIVPVYDYGEENGRPYFVMRLMTGGSLADRLKGGALSIAEIRYMLDRIDAALDKAHEQGIVHRDIKLANILYDDDDGEPYLSDFGIVKVAQSTTLTQTGGIVGTPAYMSPEQVLGEKDIDGRTDIYSMGAILFEMLSGRLPY
jgi:serine/threonine protein kinase